MLQINSGVKSDDAPPGKPGGPPPISSNLSAFIKVDNTVITEESKQSYNSDDVSVDYEVKSDGHHYDIGIPAKSRQ